MSKAGCVVTLDSSHGLLAMAFPVECDLLWLVLTADLVEMMACNRCGIAVFTVECESVKCIRRVPCKLDERKE